MAPPSEHSLVVEESKLRCSCTPSKGGSFALPMGAKILMPEGLVARRDAITCTVVPPGQRWQHGLLFPGEHLTSEVFALSGNVQCKDKKILLQLPYYSLREKMMELNVKGRWKGDSVWVDVGFLQKSEEPPLVELELDRLGMFVVTFRLRREVFSVTPSGCLYNLRLYKHLSIRFPKKAVDTTINYTAQVHVVPEHTVQYVKSRFPLECGDIQKVTEIFDFIPDVDCDFRRPATIKLPLPEGVTLKEGPDAEGEESNDIFVLRKVKDTWDTVGSSCKFTRGTVAFDLKNPSRLCVVKSKPERDRKMRDALRFLEQELGRAGGEVSVFLSLRDKSWMVVVECCAQAHSAARKQFREQQGCSTTEHLPLAPTDEVAWPARRHPPKKEVRTVSRVEFWDGLSWTIDLKGELTVCGDSDLLQNNELRYFKYLPESYRNFIVEPAEQEQRALAAFITLTPVGIEDVSLRQGLTFTFRLHIPEEKVRAHHHVVPEPLPEVEPAKANPKISTELPPTRPAVQPARRVKSHDISPEAIERLSRPTRRAPRVAAKNNARAEREAKVLSGRSLMTMSKVVTEGLTLAVYLNLPDTVITGIGFDALAQGNSMSDISYRILLHWKRTCADKRDGAVQQLAEALRKMKKSGIADVLLDQHQQNKELTSDAFLQAAVHGVQLS